MLQNDIEILYFEQNKFNIFTWVNILIYNLLKVFQFNMNSRHSFKHWKGYFGYIRKFIVGWTRKISNITKKSNLKLKNNDQHQIILLIFFEININIIQYFWGFYNNY
jgi:hypothetical protein